MTGRHKNFKAHLIVHALHQTYVKRCLNHNFQIFVTLGLNMSTKNIKIADNFVDMIKTMSYFITIP